MTDSDGSAKEDNVEKREPSQTAPDWKSGYLEILREERARSGPDTPAGSEEAADMIDCYWLYDIDKDGIPELLIRFGDCEAAYHGSCFTVRNNRVELLDDEITMGHTTFQADPGENGIISYWGHMGYAACSRLSVSNDGLVAEELFEDDINERLAAGDEDAWYRPASDVVKGSFYLMSYDKMTDLPILQYETIASAQDGAVLKTAEQQPVYPLQDAVFFDRIIAGKGTVETVTSDPYMLSPGRVSFTELLNAKNIYPYSEDELSVTDRTDADLNGDGKLECVLHLDPKDSTDRSMSGSDYRVILSEQDGLVYAYLGFMPSETAITMDGSFVWEKLYENEEQYAERVLFDGPACAFYSVPRK
ncbi:MAG: hypothetical protein K6G16_11580 [Lachnospiraceae bacterium]|nr:hypothetical protein [Lachnospiraceae bacterium]